MPNRIPLALGLVLALLPSLVLAAPAAAQVNEAGRCVRSADPAKSVARLWDEALLDAIRRDFPAPTVHARNLYHLSAAMWDAWATYDPIAAGDGPLAADAVEAHITGFYLPDVVTH